MLENNTEHKMQQRNCFLGKKCIKYHPFLLRWQFLLIFNTSTVIQTIYYMLNKKMKFWGEGNYSFSVRRPTFLANLIPHLQLGFCVRVFVGIHDAAAQPPVLHPLAPRCSLMATNFKSICDFWELEVGVFTFVLILFKSSLPHHQVLIVKLTKNYSRI